MKISKNRLISGIVLAFLLSRILVDIAWPSSKPLAAIIYYSLFGAILSLYFIFTHRVNTKPLFPLFAIFFLPCTLMASQFNSQVDFLEHTKFALQIYIPCLFLVAITNVPDIVKASSVTYKRYFSAATIFALLLASYFSYRENSLPGEGFYEHYTNAPNHVIAQTLLKSTLPLLTSGTFWTLASFSIIFVLNVRSTILSYVLSFIVTHKKSILKKRTIKNLFLILVPILAIAAFQIDWPDVYNRTIYKNRSSDGLDIFEVATSGRTNIYQFYISHIINNFTFMEWVFGAGPIWIREDSSILSAHNDFLNLLVSFGLTGLACTLACYFYFYSKLPTTGKSIFAATFIVLFLTNGVTFHQSNILFALLYFYKNDKTHPQLLVRSKSNILS